MDILEFLARSEWPVVVGGVVVMFRRSFRRMLDRINPTEIDGWGVHLKFAAGMDKIEAVTKDDAKAIKAENPKMAFDSMPAAISEKLDIERLPPGVRILLSWENMIAELRSVIASGRAQSSQKNLRKPVRIDEIGRSLGFDASRIGALKELETLRNQIAHVVDPPVTSEDADRFESAAKMMVFYAKTR